MRAHIATAAALLTAAVLTAPADAAGCQHLVVDPQGDTSILADPSLGEDNTPGMDIVSADMATSRSRISAEIEVVDLRPQATTLSLMEYKVLFTSDAGAYYLSAFQGFDGVTFALYKVDGLTGTKGLPRPTPPTRSAMLPVR